MIPLPDTRETLFERDCRLWARDAGNAELLDRIDSLRLTPDPFEEGYPGCEVELHRIDVRLRACSAELARRRHRAAARPGLPDPAGVQYRAWCDVAKEIRERISLPWLFDHLGYQLSPAGTNGRRGDEEWSGACPLCAGRDRLRVWAGPNGRAWCRQCGWSADAIVAAQSLDRSLVGFYPAVRFLAELVGIPVPDDAIPPPASHSAVDVGSGAPGDATRPNRPVNRTVRPQPPAFGFAAGKVVAG